MSLPIVELAAQRVVAALHHVPQAAASLDDARGLWLAIEALDRHIGRAADRAQARATAAVALAAVLAASAAKFSDHEGPFSDSIASAGWRLEDLLTDDEPSVIAHASGLQIVFGDDMCTGTPDAPLDAPASAAPRRKPSRLNDSPRTQRLCTKHEPEIGAIPCATGDAQRTRPD